VPVIGEDGAVAGMVREGDLIGRREAGQDSDRRDWWLSLLADGEPLSPDFLATLHSTAQAARDVRVAPVVTVTEATDVAGIAELLTTRWIKGVPVMRGDRVVGIVNRSDLLRTMAGLPRSQATTAEAEPPSAARRPVLQPANGAPASVAGEPSADVPSADIFRSLEDDFRTANNNQVPDAKSTAASQVELRIKALIETHIDGPIWSTMLTGARRGGRRGRAGISVGYFSERSVRGSRPGDQRGRDWLAFDVARRGCRDLPELGPRSLAALVQVFGARAHLSGRMSRRRGAVSGLGIADPRHDCTTRPFGCNRASPRTHVTHSRSRQRRMM